jgi:hypothetical protein
MIIVAVQAVSLGGLLPLSWLSTVLYYVSDEGLFGLCVTAPSCTDLFLVRHSRLDMARSTALVNIAYCFHFKARPNAHLPCATYSLAWPELKIATISPFM